MQPSWFLNVQIDLDFSDLCASRCIFHWQLVGFLLDVSSPFSCSVRDAKIQTEPEIGSEMELSKQVFEQKSQLEITFLCIEALQNQFFSVVQIKKL